MQRCLLVLIICLFSTYVAGQDGTENVSGIPEATKTFQHDGVWKPKGAMLSGVLLPPPVLQTITLRIEKGTYEVTVDGEDHSDKGTFTLDETATPKRMTIKSTAGPNKGKTILAIYEIKDADAMRVCYDLSGREFPKEFKAPKDSERYLVGYRRQRAEENAKKVEPPAKSDRP